MGGYNGPQRAFSRPARRARGFRWRRPTSLQAAPLTLRFAHFAAEIIRPTSRPSNSPAASKTHQRRDQDQYLSQQRAWRAAGAGAADQARHHRHGPADQGQLDKYDKAFAAVMLPFIFDSPQHSFSASSTARPWNGWRRLPKSRALSSCATGNMAFATSPTSCGRSTPPTT